MRQIITPSPYNTILSLNINCTLSDQKHKCLSDLQGTNLLYYSFVFRAQLLGTRGRGFPPAIMNDTPAYFCSEIEEK